MKPTLVITLVLLAFASYTPVAAAHACSGTQSDCVCPAPSDGKAHSHAGPSGSCTNGASATPGGASVPAPALPLVVAAMVLALVAFRRG